MLSTLQLQNKNMNDKRGGGTAACCYGMNKYRMVGGFLQPALICRGINRSSDRKGKIKLPFCHKVNFQTNKHILKVLWMI